MIRVNQIKAIGDCRIRCQFSDGMAGEYDLSAIIAGPGPMAEPLREPSFFARVYLERGAPTWPNGYDIAPGWLYRMMQESGCLSPALAA
jgi:hypothetical protein